MFVCFYRHILVINPVLQDFMWHTISNFYVVYSRIRIQFFYNYHFQFIKSLQPTINFGIIQLYTRPFKWQSLVCIGLLSGPPWYRIISISGIVNLLESSYYVLKNILSHNIYIPISFPIQKKPFQYTFKGHELRSHFITINSKGVNPYPFKGYELHTHFITIHSKGVSHSFQYIPIQRAWLHTHSLHSFTTHFVPKKNV